MTYKIITNNTKMNIYRKTDLLGRLHFSQDFDYYYITAGTESDTDRSDVYATARTNPLREYVIEIKDYTNSKHERNYTKFIYKGEDHGYQIDYDKIDYLMQKYYDEGRIPILYARFNDYTIIWDIRDIPYKERKKQVLVNKDGQHYHQEMELSDQTYLYFNEAKWHKLTN